jgi:hypothetical protein
MQHPFMPDISEKKLEELQESVNDLTGKLQFAYRMSNAPMIHQLNMVLDGYKAEIAKRLDELYKRQNLNQTIKISKEQK